MISFSATFLTSLILTGFLRYFCGRVGFVCKPSRSRWSQRTVAMGGGVAIVASILLGTIVTGNTKLTEIALPLFIIAFLGFADDLWKIPPANKLIVQALTAAVMAWRGYVLPIPYAPLAFIVTCVWIVGITNAVNLLDNMDGISSGVAAVCAFMMAWMLPKSPGLASLALITSAACLGFLIHNFYPARIFMGDTGSLSLGFLLSVLSTKLDMKDARLPEYYSLGLPLLVLLVPIFDTLLVMLTRTMVGKSIFNGGRDHSTHRLVNLGLSEQQTAVFLYFLSFTGGAIALMVSYLHRLWFIGSATLFTCTLVFMFIFLVEVQVYGKPKKNFNPYKLPRQLMFGLEVLLDFFAVTMIAVFSGIENQSFILLTKIVLFMTFRLYRGLWQTIERQDIIRILAAVSCSSMFILIQSGLLKTFKSDLPFKLGLDWILTVSVMVLFRSMLTIFREMVMYISKNKKRTHTNFSNGNNRRLAA